MGHYREQSSPNGNHISSDGECKAKVITSPAMARRPDRHETEVLSEENLKEVRYNLAHLSLPAVRDAYEQAYKDCRLIYNRIPTPKQMQILVQVWKQLWRWR